MRLTVSKIQKQNRRRCENISSECEKKTVQWFNEIFANFAAKDLSFFNLPNVVILNNFTKFGFLF